MSSVALLLHAHLFTSKYQIYALSDICHICLDMLLMHLLHPNVLKRITDTELYGNTYKLPEYLTDLTDAIFKQDRKTAVNSSRQNLQLLYTNYLIQYLGNKRTLMSTRSQVLYQLNEVLKISKENSDDLSTKAHKLHLNLIIKNTLETK